MDCVTDRSCHIAPVECDVCSGREALQNFHLTGPSNPRDIVSGPDGNLWFAEYLAGMLARIRTDGVVTEVLEVGGGPWGIGRGVGDTIWLTQFDGNRVARFNVANRAAPNTIW